MRWPPFAQRDLQQPFLSAAPYRALLAAALAYLRDERDILGFDPVKGWIHSTAHTEDLLANLARNPRFTQPFALFESHTYPLEALLARMPTQTSLSPAATQARDAARAALRKR